MVVRTDWKASRHVRHHSLAAQKHIVFFSLLCMSSECIVWKLLNAIALKGNNKVVLSRELGSPLSMSTFP